MEPQSWSSWLARKFQSAKTAIVPERAQPLLSDQNVVNTTGAASEPKGQTITGGRRHRTRKARKGRKTRRGNRKH